MRRRPKIDNAVLKRIRQREEKDRLISVREERVKYFIVCEGTKTEPNYFEAFKKELHKGVLTHIDGTGRNTISLVEYTIECLTASDEKYDHVWVIFDKDSFQAEQFNEAIDKANRNSFKVAYSNEAFEPWYLLHFNYYDMAFSRYQYEKKLSELIGKNYCKNDPDIYQLLKEKGDQSKAIEWAKKLFDSYGTSHNPAKENPSTTVHLLVSELNKFKTGY